MLSHDLRSLRIAIDAIRQQAFTHRSRNKKLAVLRSQIDALIRRHESFAHDPHLHGLVVRETLTDGLRALNDFARDRDNWETHTDVLNRMLLLTDMVSYLIQAAEMNTPAHLTPDAKWQFSKPSQPGDLPAFDDPPSSSMVNRTLDDLDAAPPASVWDNILDEIEGRTDEPDDTPDEFEF